MKKDILKKLAAGLNQLNCTWGIGGSVLLNNYDLIDKPKDIDVLIDASSADEVKSFMDTIGEYVELPSKEPFKTKEFFGYIVDDVMIEFLGDFEIDLGNNKSYKFILDNKAITNDIVVDGVKVNLSTLEDWYVAYSVMEDPKKRIPLLKEYFNNSGISHKNLLKRNLNQNLPQHIKLDIESLLLLK